MPELQGLEALFDVKIKALKDSIYPELNDEFAAKISEASSVDELKLKVSRNPIRVARSVLAQTRCVCACMRSKSTRV